MCLNGFKCDSRLDYLSVILQNPNSNTHVVLVIGNGLRMYLYSL